MNLTEFDLGTIGGHIVGPPAIPCPWQTVLLMQATNRALHVLQMSLLCVANVLEMCHGNL